MVFLLAFLTFVSLALAGWALTSYLTDREEAREAIQRRVSLMTGRAQNTATSILKDTRLSTIGSLNSMLGRLSFAEPLNRMIRRAGLRKRVGEILLYCVLFMVIAILVALLAKLPVLVALLIGLVSGSIPLLAVARIRNKRATLFGEQLPEALDLMRAALQAGHGLMSAFNVVADEFPDPIAQEFRDLTEEVRLGLPMRDALANLGDRIDNQDLNLLQVGILVASDVGGNLAEVLDNLSHTIRERFKIQREIQTLTAQGRLSGQLLTVLPFVAGGVLSLIIPGYLTPLFKEPTGRLMLIYAGVSLIIGQRFIRKIVRTEV